MPNLGFKNLTVDNWLTPDEVSVQFGRMHPNGQIRPMTGDEWVCYFLEPKLAETVPAEIHDLFAVARGAMAYGYFFYPLYTLAAEQVLRVLEAAVAHKCKMMGASESKKTFKKQIEWLVEEAVIQGSEKEVWEAARKLRNSASHPEMQSLLVPAQALSFLERAAKVINSLFDGA